MFSATNWRRLQPLLAKPRLLQATFLSRRPFFEGDILFEDMIRQEKKFAKQQMKRVAKHKRKKQRRREENFSEESLVYDITDTGNFNLHTKNMKKVQRFNQQKEHESKKQTKKHHSKVKEAKIIKRKTVGRQPESSSSSQESSESEAEFEAEQEEKQKANDPRVDKVANQRMKSKMRKMDKQLKYESKKKKSASTPPPEGKEEPISSIDSSLGYSSVKQMYQQSRSRSQHGGNQPKESLLSKVLNQCTTEKKQVSTFMNTFHFKEILLRFYRIMHQIVTRDKIKEFLEEIEVNQSYQTYVENWRNLKRMDKLRQMQKDGWIYEFNPGKRAPMDAPQSAMQILNVPTRHLIVLKPYIELFTDFLQRQHEEELNASQELCEIADMKMPWDWFPDTRERYPVREFHYHMGPTNSGKTKQAVEILKKAETGCYLAPLRLLAMEMQGLLTKTSINEETGETIEGVPCNLMTGPLRERYEGACHSAATIEMADFKKEFDVAVIDEIQMLEDDRRGHNWTNALLGLKAKEIHLCGDERALSLICNMLSKTGDTLTVHRYGRLSKLRAEKQHIKSWGELREGDCIICFSKKKLHKMKEDINRHFNSDHDGNLISSDNHCSIIYGALPPESKIIQANCFNERQDKVKFLLATDAVGMGLNLNIKRIIFSTMTKMSNGKMKVLTQNDVQQIAGRAGRFMKDGLVNSFFPGDLKMIERYCKPMNTSFKNEKDVSNLSQEHFLSDLNIQESFEIKDLATYNEFSHRERQIKKAALFPPFEQLAYFGEKLTDTTLRTNSSKGQQGDDELHMTEIVKRFSKVADLSGSFFMKNSEEECWIFDAIQHVKFITPRERFQFAKAPLNANRLMRGKNKKMKTHPTKSIMGVYARFVEQFAALRDEEYYQFAMELENLNEPLSPLDTEYMNSFTQVVPLPEEFNLDYPLFNQTSLSDQDLTRLENIINICDVYLWLGNHFPASFSEEALSLLVRERCNDLICEELAR